MIDDRFERLLQERIGLDAASIGSASIERAVRERVLALDSDAPGSALLTTSTPLSQAQRDHYWLRLCESDDEVQRLVEAVVVPETWFFRDREAFTALANMARERYARWPDRVLRLVSLPCSTGEEPYTIAMALLDAGLPASAFSIDAFDISTRALAHATHGIYGRNAFRGHALEFRDRHFSVEGNAWKLHDAVRRAVRFAQLNLFDAASHASAPYDFVFCRNVLIYFDRDDQARAVDVLERLLASDGTLFVGPSETGSLFRHAMQSARIPLAFAFRKSAAPAPDHTATLRALHTRLTRVAGAARAEGQSAMSTYSATAAAPAVRRATPAPDSVSRARPSTNGHRAFDGKPARQPVAAPLTQPNDATRSAGLDGALKLADAGRLGEATLAADAHLTTFGPSPEVFYLLGLIADADGRRDDAADFYRKALYLDPAHYEALTHLATLLESQGDRDGANRLTERAARANSLRLGGHG